MVEDGIFLSEIIPKEEISLVDFVLKKITQEKIIDFIYKTLTKREILMLFLRFGLIDGKEWKYEDIGQKMGISGERVRMIERKNLYKIKNGYIYEENKQKIKKMNK